MVTPVFATVFAAALLAMMTYNAFETLMPVSLTTEHGYPAASWGILFVVNPVLVMLFQLRVTRWTTGIPRHEARARAGADGLRFLPLVTTAWAPVLVLILVVFVAGEMLWAPAADALAAKLAPPEARGATMGTMGIAMWVGGALAPALGLHVADTAGDAAMWTLIAVVGLAAGALYWTGARLLGSAPAPAAEVAEADLAALSARAGAQHRHNGRRTVPVESDAERRGVVRVVELLEQPLLVRPVDEHVDACRDAAELEVLAVEVRRIAVGVARRGALLDGQRPGSALLAVAEEDGRAEVADALRRVAVVVGEAEARLAVADDEREVGRAPELEALEAEQVPVVVRRCGVYQSRPASSYTRTPPSERRTS